jgi:hypothetical protein
MVASTRSKAKLTRADLKQDTKSRTQRKSLKRNIDARVETSNKAQRWDVTGTYRITCEKIESEFGEPEEGFSLKLYRVKRKNDMQMFGKFNFGVVEGWLRFETQEPEEAKARVDRFRAAEQKECKVNVFDGVESDDDVKYLDYFADEDEKVEAEYYENYIREAIHAPFLLSSGETSSKFNRTWNYRWRGRETGENEIVLEEDTELYSITFGEGGTELTGSFGCGYIDGVCNIQGVKVETGKLNAGSRIDIEDKWRRLNDSAYDYEQQPRFRGWE